MNSKKTLFLIAVAAIVALSSCSGQKNACTTNCGGGGGNSSLSITISDTPPASATVISFALPIIGITLTPSSGSAVSVFSSNPSTDFELTRLQTDTNVIATNVEVTAASYTAVNVTVAAPSGVLANAGATVGSCLTGRYCSLTGGAATITYKFTSPLVLTANSKQWLNLDFNYNNAIVTTGSSIGIDVTQTGVMTASSTVPTGVPSGNFANIDDFTGAVTAVSSSSITLQSSVRGNITASIGSSTQVFDPQNLCASSSNLLSCVQVGTIVSLQGQLSTSGVVTATSLDLIDISTSPSDEVEGTIFQSSCNGAGTYGMYLSDSEIFTSGSPLLSASFGSGVCLTLSQSASFEIDTGILTGQGVPTTAGFNNSSDIVPGQVVRAKVNGAAAGTAGIINVTATALLLRYSRLTGTVASDTGTIFSISGLPAYLGVGSLQVQTYSTATLFEGVTGASSLTTGQTVSISALFLNPSAGITYPFQAVKVRTTALTQ